MTTTTPTTGLNLGSLLSSIAAFGAKIWNNDIKPVYTYFKPLIVATAEELGQLALSAVLAQAPLVITGTQKFSNAVASVQATLAAAGKTALVTDIGIAVQASHDYISTGSAPAVTTIKTVQGS